MRDLSNNKQKLKYKMYENQIFLVFGAEDKDETMHWWKVSHAKATDRYHEIYRIEDDKYIGISHLAPDDCWKCGRNISRSECKNLGYSIKE